MTSCRCDSGPVRRRDNTGRAYCAGCGAMLTSDRITTPQTDGGTEDAETETDHDDTLRFDIINDDSKSLTRAREEPAEIVTEPTGNTYLVAFESSENVHEVELHRHPDGWKGDCYQLDEQGNRTGRCRGFAFHDGPCAHLWRLRSHVARERLDDQDARHSHDIETAVADGGRRKER